MDGYLGQKVEKSQGMARDYLDEVLANWTPSQVAIKVIRINYESDYIHDKMNKVGLYLYVVSPDCE